MDTAIWAIIIAGLALAVNIGVHVFGGGWNLSTKIATMQIELRKAINDSKDEIERKQDAIAKDFIDREARLTREFGETVSALRQKVHEIETWARDEFVRKGSFENSLDRLDRTVGDQFANIDKRLERMEAKIDSKT